MRAPRASLPCRKERSDARERPRDHAEGSQRPQRLQVRAQLRATLPLLHLPFDCLRAHFRPAHRPAESAQKLAPGDVEVPTGTKQATMSDGHPVDAPTRQTTREPI